MTSMAGGRRPADIDPKRVEELAAEGLGKYQIAEALGVHYTTLLAHEDRNPEISDALKRGEAAAVGKVENALYMSAIQGNLGAQVFFLKNRSGGKWRDKTEQAVSLSTPAGALDDDALAAIAAGSGARTSAKADGSA